MAEEKHPNVTSAWMAGNEHGSRHGVKRGRWQGFLVGAGFCSVICTVVITAGNYLGWWHIQLGKGE